MNNFEDFVKSLFENSYFNLEEVNRKKEEDKKELLNEIGWLLLVYFIENGFLKIPKLTQNKLYNKLSKKILDMFSDETEQERATVTEILENTLHESSIFYDLEFKVGLNKDAKVTGELINKDAQKFIKKKYKGSTFSKRIWENNNEISKELQNEIEKLLKGETSVNEIKKNIEDRFETSKYNAKRLVDTEVARVHDEVFKKYCKDNGVEELIYKATFCNTCEKCRSNHNKVFKIDEAPNLPQHPNCKCYFSIKNIYT